MSFFSSFFSSLMSFFSPLLSVPPGCWPGCGPEPSVLVTPLTGLLAVVLSWPEGSVPPSPSAAELLESGSATATAPPAPPISRPAASTQTPKATRKCDRPTICSPQPQDSSPAFQRLQHCRMVRPSGLRESQTRYARSTVSSKPFLRRRDAQSARSGSANDACAQRRRPGRSQSVNDSQKRGGLAVRPRRQQLCTSTGRLASEVCEDFVHWMSAQQPRVGLTVDIS